METCYTAAPSASMSLTGEQCEAYGFNLEWRFLAEPSEFYFTCREKNKQKYPEIFVSSINTFWVNFPYSEPQGLLWMVACSRLSHSLPLHHGARLLVKRGCSGIKQKNPKVLFVDIHTVVWEELLLIQEKAENNIQPWIRQYPSRRSFVWSCWGR